MDPFGEVDGGKRLAQLVETQKQMGAKLNGKRYWAEKLYRNPGSSQSEGQGSLETAIGLCTEDGDYIGKIKELEAYLDTVKMIVKPGCSQEVLKMALSFMSSLVHFLTSMSSTPKRHSSL